MHKIKVNGEVKRFSLDLEACYQAQERHGIRVGWADLSPMSFGSMVKFAWAGFMAEDPELDRSTAIEWLQEVDQDELSRVILRDLQASGMVEVTVPADEGDGIPLSESTSSTGAKSDTSG